MSELVPVSTPGQCCGRYCVEDIDLHDIDRATAERIAHRVADLIQEGHPHVCDYEEGQKAALNAAAQTLLDLTLTMVSTSGDEGTALTAAVVHKCAQIVRQTRTEDVPELDGRCPTCGIIPAKYGGIR